MKDELKYEKAYEVVMQNKPYDALSAEEKALFESKDEYLSMQYTLLQLDQPEEEVEPDPSIKQALLHEMQEQKGSRPAVWLNGIWTFFFPREKQFYQYPAFQLATLAVLVVSVWWVMQEFRQDTNNPQLALQEEEKKKEEPTKNKTEKDKNAEKETKEQEVDGNKQEITSADVQPKDKVEEEPVLDALEQPPSKSTESTADEMPSEADMVAVEEDAAEEEPNPAGGFNMIEKEEVADRKSNEVDAVIADMETEAPKEEMAVYGNKARAERDKVALSKKKDKIRVEGSSISTGAVTQDQTVSLSDNLDASHQKSRSIAIDDDLIDLMHTAY